MIINEYEYNLNYNIMWSDIRLMYKKNEVYLYKTKIYFGHIEKVILIFINYY